MKAFPRIDPIFTTVSAERATLNSSLATGLFRFPNLSSKLSPLLFLPFLLLSRSLSLLFFFALRLRFHAFEQEIRPSFVVRRSFVPKIIILIDSPTNNKISASISNFANAYYLYAVTDARRNTWENTVNI